MTITAAGIYPDITAREYFAEPCPQPALTNSGIKTILAKTPLEFAYAHPGITPDSPEAASTAAKRFGDVAHQLSLGKGRGYAVGDYPTWGSNDAKRFKAGAEEAGLTPVKRAEFEAAEKCAAIMKDKIAETVALLGGAKYQTEVVMAWQEETSRGPIWCRAMMDVWADDIGLIIDPKFSGRLHDGEFENHASNMGWDFQDSFYRRGITKIRPDLAGRVRFVNLLCDPKPPHVWRCREADEATTYSCELEIDRAIEKFAACLYAREWPGYPKGIEPWTAKSYTMAQRAANSIMETEE